MIASRAAEQSAKIRLATFVLFRGHKEIRGDFV
jgi:hypothetical protein